MEARWRREAHYATLVVVGAWLGHELGYLIAHSDPILRAASLGGHGYLDMARALLAPLGALALARLAVVKSREANLRSLPKPLRLASMQVAVFLAVEVLERIPHGHIGEIAHEPAIVIGAALMLPISAAMAWAVRATAALVSAFRPGTEPKLHSAPPPLWVPVRTVVPVGTALFSALRRRGPPVNA
jgi:hypothetical protein